jgi:hypothetical protein
VAKALDEATVRDPLRAAMGARPIWIAVDGSPFQPGDRVRVVQVLDDTVDDTVVGLAGVVLYLEYSCGCGQTYPHDPMIGVDLGERVEEFWREELERAEETRR